MRPEFVIAALWAAISVITALVIRRYLKADRVSMDVGVWIIVTPLVVVWPAFWLGLAVTWLRMQGGRK